MLAHQWHSEHGTPVVFLHGLLGSQDDWQQVVCLLQSFPQIRPLTIDLPFHGKSANHFCRDFADIGEQLHDTLSALIPSEPFGLVGYSLGGRIALQYHLSNRSPHLLGTVLEGTNIGLQTENERLARWQNDQHWANRFRVEPIENVLLDWYQQPVFSHLTKSQRQTLIAKRKGNNGTLIAQMLEATSLAKQPFFNLNKRSDLTKNLQFLIGEHDQKFRQLAQQNNLPHQLVPLAGHNTHVENPQGFVEKLLAFLIPKNKKD